MGNKNLSLWNDILNPRQTGRAQQAPAWEITTRNKDGSPGIICKNGKEWFDADKTWRSPSGEYMLHEGMNANGDDAIALTRNGEGLRLRKIEGLATAALITDVGTGYVLTDEGVLHILTADKTSQRQLCEDYAPNAYILTPELCIVIYDADSNDDLEAANLKVLDLKTLKSWKKKLKYNTPAPGKLKFSIELDNGNIKVTLPDQTVHQFVEDGK